MAPQSNKGSDVHSMTYGLEHLDRFGHEALDTVLEAQMTNRKRVVGVTWCYFLVLGSGGGLE